MEVIGGKLPKGARDPLKVIYDIKVQTKTEIHIMQIQYSSILI
jgi:hypothetical protein